MLIASYEALGRFEEAAALMGCQRCFGFQFDGTALTDAFRTGGPRGYWQARLDAMNALASPPQAVHFGRAIVYHRLGDRERELASLDAMKIAQHVGGAIFIAVDPTLRLLAGEPRYEAMIRQVGVPLQRTASAPRTVSR